MNEKELELIREIRYGLMNEGKVPSVRILMKRMGYKSPQSIQKLVKGLEEQGIIKKKENGKLQLLDNPEPEAERTETVIIPLIGRVACGGPVLAEENTEAMIPVSVKLAQPPHSYFLLRAQGDSMNEKGIDDGDMVLVRQQETATNGESVVALIDEEATIKELHASDQVIVLKPCSSNPSHKNIILTRDFRVQGVVVATIPGF